MPTRSWIPIALAVALLAGADTAHGLSVSFVFPGPFVALTIADGGPNDLDPAPGTLRFDLAGSPLASSGGFTLLEGTVTQSLPVATSLMGFIGAAMS